MIIMTLMSSATLLLSTLALSMTFFITDHVISGEGVGDGNVWIPVDASVVEPPPLQFHTATVVANFMVVFGGVDPSNYQTSNTTWLLNLNTEVWTSCPDVSIDNVETPVTRVLHTMVAVADSQGNPDALGLMFGGLTYPDSRTLSDTWLFNPSNCSWTRVNTTAGFPVSARAGHGAVAVTNTAVLVLGGCTDAFMPKEGVPLCRSTFPTDAYVFDVARASLGWQEVQGVSGFVGSFAFNMLIEWQGAVKASNATVYVLFGVSLPASTVTHTSSGPIFLQATIAAGFSAASSSLAFANFTGPTFEVTPRPSVIISTETQQFIVVGFVAGSYNGQPQQPTVWLLDIANMAQGSAPPVSVFSTNIPLLTLLANNSVFLDGSCAVARNGMLYHGFSFNQLAVVSDQACNLQQSSVCEAVRVFFGGSSQKTSFVPFVFLGSCWFPCFIIIIASCSSCLLLQLIHLCTTSNLGQTENAECRYLGKLPDCNTICSK